MRRLILTTASILALGIGGAGLAQAQGNSTQGGTSAKTPSAETSMPQAQTSMPSSEMKGSQTHRMATRSTRASTSEVKQVQQRLREEGLYRGRIDGKLGPRTKTALRSFQKKNGLPASASLDQRTMEALQGGGTGQGAGMTQEGSSQTNPSATQMMPQGGQQGQAGNAGAGAGNGAATTGSSITQPGQKKY